MAHQSYYNHDNKEIPSVTQILKIINKSGIVEWANILGFYKIKYKPFLDEKATIGTYVHERIERYFNGKDPKENEKIFDVDIEKKVNERYNIFLIWNKGCDPKPIKIEESYNNNRYGGTVDAILEINGEVVLVDFKTSKKPYSIYFLQLGGYLNLIKELDKELYDKIAYVQVITFGKGLLIETKYKENMHKYEDCFEFLYNLYIKWKNILETEWNETIE